MRKRPKVSDAGWQEHWHFAFRFTIPNAAHSAPGLYVQTTELMYRYAKCAVWPKHRENIEDLLSFTTLFFFLQGSRTINLLFMHFWVNESEAWNNFLNLVCLSQRLEKRVFKSQSTLKNCMGL